MESAGTVGIWRWIWTVFYYLLLRLTAPNRMHPTRTHTLMPHTGWSLRLCVGDWWVTLALWGRSKTNHTNRPKSTSSSPETCCQSLSLSVSLVLCFSFSRFFSSLSLSLSQPLVGFHYLSHPLSHYIPIAIAFISFSASPSLPPSLSPALSVFHPNSF